MSAISILFHLHGKDVETDGVPIDLKQGTTIQELRKAVAEKFTVALPGTISFHVSADAATTPSDLTTLDTVDAVLGERTVAILISGKKVGRSFCQLCRQLTTEYQVRPVPGPTGGIPFIGGYSEIYPDFMGNYQRLLRKYGHIVNVNYLGKVRPFYSTIFHTHTVYSPYISLMIPTVPVSCSARGNSLANRRVPA